MIEIYQTIARAVASAPGIRHADIGPRVPDNTVVYPAAFVQDIDYAPEEIGDKKYFGEFTFTVAVYIKPYHDSRERPKPARTVHNSLAASFAPVQAIRQVIYNLNDPAVQNTVLQGENLTRDNDGTYIITQRWKAVAVLDFAPVPAPKPPTPKLAVETQRIASEI